MRIKIMYDIHNLSIHKDITTSISTKKDSFSLS